MKDRHSSYGGVCGNEEHGSENKCKSNPQCKWTGKIQQLSYVDLFIVHSLTNRSCGS